MRIIKTIETPQDIYILGCDIYQKEQSFSLTDDYCVLKVTNKSHYLYIDTCGFGYILTRDELIEYKDLIDDNDYSQEGLILKDFSGDMVLRVVNGNDDILQKDFDIKDYVMYQTLPLEDGEYYVYLDVILELPESTALGERMTVEEILNTL